MEHTENEQNYIKHSLICGFVGAAAMPFIYECYANVMREFAIALALFGCVFASYILTKYRFAQSLCAVMFFTVISGGLGLFIEIMLHSHIVSFLEKHSKYFYLSYKEISVFVFRIIMCYIAAFVVCFVRCGLRKALLIMRGNAEKSKSFIDNAFGDDDE